MANNQPNNAHLSGYISTFDSIRAIAVLAVFLSHSRFLRYITDGRTEKFLEGLAFGNFGVILFFVLSGFLITRILIKAKGKAGAYKNFVIRRSLRIFPIYYICIIALAFMYPGGYLAECALYISNYTFSIDVSSNPMRHTWSLCVEEHFYIFWPVLVLFVPVAVSRSIGVIAIPLVSVGSAFLTYILIPEHAEAIFYRGTHTQMFALAAGSALAYYEPAIRSSPKRTLTLAIVALPIAALIFGILGFADAPGRIIKFYTYTFVSISIVLAALASHDCGGITQRVLSNGVTSYIGRISYGLYLYHFPVYYAFGNLNDPDPQLSIILISTAVSFGIAICSYHFIEKPILKLKDRFQ